MYRRPFRKDSILAKQTKQLTKVKALLKHQITLVCVGESLEQGSRCYGKVCATQINRVTRIDTPEEKIVIAYEPIWAIGTGKTASAEDAQETIKYIRSVLAECFGESPAQKIRIQYGGSVKPGNIKELMAQPDIDGALVGGASLKAEDFAAIINYKK